MIYQAKQEFEQLLEWELSDYQKIAGQMFYIRQENKSDSRDHLEIVGF